MRVAIVAGLLAAVGCAKALPTKPPAVAAGKAEAAAPAGFTRAREPVGQFSLLLPGEIVTGSHSEGGRELTKQEAANKGCWHDGGKFKASVTSRPGSAATAAALTVHLEKYHNLSDANFQAAPTKTNITLGGKPGLKVAGQKRSLHPSATPEFHVYAVASNGTRIVDIQIITEHKEPDAATLSTILDSFAFE